MGACDDVRRAHSGSDGAHAARRAGPDPECHAVTDAGPGSGDRPARRGRITGGPAAVPDWEWQFRASAGGAGRWDVGESATAVSRPSALTRQRGQPAPAPDACRGLTNASSRQTRQPAASPLLGHCDSAREAHGRVGQRLHVTLRAASVHHRSASAGGDHGSRVAHRCVLFCRRSRGRLPYALSVRSEWQVLSIPQTPITGPQFDLERQRPVG